MISAMKKPKRRYHSAEQIDSDIAKAKQRATDLIKSAESLNNLAKEHFKLAETDNILYREMGIEEMDRSRQLLRKATKILDIKVGLLCAKRSSLLTPIMPGIIPDTSIEA